MTVWSVWLVEQKTWCRCGTRVFVWRNEASLPWNASTKHNWTFRFDTSRSKSEKWLPDSVWDRTFHFPFALLLYLIVSKPASCRRLLPPEFISILPVTQSVSVPQIARECAWFISSCSGRDGAACCSAVQGRSERRDGQTRCPDTIFLLPIRYWYFYNPIPISNRYLLVPKSNRYQHTMDDIYFHYLFCPVEC